MTSREWAEPDCRSKHKRGGAVVAWTRREDERLVTGKGRYVADIEVPGCLDAVFVRSRIGHGTLRSVDCGPARAVPGVVGAWAATDLAEMPPCVHSAAALQDLPPVPHTVLAKLSSDEAVAGREWPALVKERVRYAGEALAVVLGEDRYRAEDGAAEVTFEIDPLPAMVTPSAAADDSLLLFDGLSNVALQGEAGKPIEDAVWREAAAVVEGRYRQSLLMPSPMECRTILAVPEGDDTLTVWSGHQMPHRLRRELAALLGWSLDRVRVVVPDTGGAFGSKSASFPEFVVVAFLASKLKRPVRWIEDRKESMTAAARGRGQDQHARLASDADGRLLAYQLNIDADVGAYPHLGVGLPMQTAWMATGPYATPEVHATVRSVLTNTMVTYPYRGAGRPEAVIALERSMDTLARKLGMDPAELRRRNFIAPESFPYDTPSGRTYDSGNYAAALDLALKTVDYDRWRAEQARRRTDATAKPLGIGLSCYVERSGGEPGGLHEFGSIEANPDGTITARCGAASSGQGHETVFPALVAKTLGVDEERVRLIEGDTGEQPEGLGSFASRTAQVAGALLQHVSHLLIGEARKRAAGLWKVPLEQVEWSDGTVHDTQNGSAVMDLSELVKATGTLKVNDRFETKTAFPFGAHVAVAEVDPELGTVQLLQVVTVDDCGVQLNPTLVRGQAFGSCLQGIGQALYEAIPYDDDGAPMLGNGLLDYLLPTFTEVPPIEVRDTCTPSPGSPLGAKGAGESGCIGTPAAVVNAVIDALQVAEPDLLQMPLTPDVVWRAARAPKLEGAR
ncbi:xanthine dehydrogenase family protein molybdopterin-binding subunit [Streptomyces sp. NBC_01242]|uniref:xanthine dehydrogenase family protein molybdopterin-binding subunit n=1 Tax=Streptomyces sp. NBC_01242 TaxID=2903795 RepID=UPI00224FD813|nr:MULTISPECIES: xanthine dehydrogenase family protein molybdopterin-binding subunit [unclassified Streptomyces]MCX4799042.1 xanthine dehydrogenase family protein molybdopterin-binding subunit [Streptomyces sp. NBC_01242]WSJ41288.1 xanthine dehydrogenase family protein molybdopterin-binding subunit [Streptomyces sp. NBC_01321]WSP67623.1 xanthine dehydrogenase family protein molybdopterin-binding subunit [Streptomyces sp. NBC_01240]WSU26691.1 xanthine dehydrogenase family protein molybdopterin-b